MARVLRWLCGTLLGIGLLPAQQASVNGPVAGFTFDLPTRSFRAIAGLLGSARLGPAVFDGDGKLDWASVAPGKNYAIAFEGGQCVLVTDLGSDRVSGSSLPGALREPEGVSWSGDGSAAVFYSLKGNWIQPVTGLPHASKAGSAVDASHLDGSLSAVATDTHGRRVAIGIAGEAGGVYLIADGQGFVPLGPLSRPAALAFSDDGGKLYALDGAIAGLVEFRLADLTSHTFALPGMAHPFAVKAGRDGASRQVVYVASRNERLFRILDASSHQVIDTVRLNFQPTGIEEFGHGSYLLAHRANADDPLWFFAYTAKPGVYFVPDAHASGEGQK
ncbi:MAG TPA: hypothetical protein VEU11_15325 [Terriglobales bacterium]|nr:hypothetical protein [Terriglobales bacterium]